MTKTCSVLAFALAGLGIAGGAGTAHAVPISYTEGADLRNDGDVPTNLGALDVGVNTVSGGIDCGPDVCFLGDPTDAFLVTLAAGLKITSVTFAVSNFNGQNTRANVRFFGPGFSVNPVQISADGLLTLFSGEANGLLNTAFVARGDSGTSGPAVSYDYVWSITVESEAPEPGTLLLFGAAIAGLGWSRRRA